MAADLAGVKLATSTVESITSDLKTISDDLNTIMGNLHDTLDTIVGQSEGPFIDDVATLGEQLYDGGCRLAACCMDLGIKIGDYLKVMLTGDQDLAGQLVERIRR